MHGARAKGLALPAVEIQHADLLALADTFRAVVDIAHHLERRAQDIANPQSDRAFVVRGDVRVVQVLEQLRLTGLEDRVRDFPAGLKLVPCHGDAVASAAAAKLECPGGRHEHDEAPLGSGDLDG